MSSKNDIKLGVFIVAAGLLIFLGKLGVFGFLGRTLWPLVLLIPGLLLHVLFFTRRAPASVLIPGGILVVYGLLFGFCNTWGWGVMAHLWPVLLLGLAVGLYEYAFYTPRSGAVAIAGIVLGILSLVLLFFSVMGTGALYVLGILLVLGGVWIIAGRGRSRSSRLWNGRG
ncbi:hypothetical protein [Paenibacillus tengchongensis]|uniref:hypothetical protein n=1 Tax=Paenibacillus tengchongensis TaxID=2608684 RepID=UPI00124F1185|nr:hypothetical protein [Paenibacillus tengchongensis]